MTAEDDDIDYLEWALAYARAGFSVMPVWPRKLVEEGGEQRWLCSCEKGTECDRPAKHPIPSQGVKQATRDEARIRFWWDEHPTANVAVATGSVSGVIVIDVDTADGKEGDIAITQACAEHGGVPRTLKATSGSGGRHYWYKFRKNPFTRKIGFLKHVDYLSDGGYVIVQPSINLKGAYTWDEELDVVQPDDVGGLRAELADLPEWFDALEGSGRAGRKSGKARATDDILARLVSNTAMEFRADEPRWVEEIRKALTHCDPDSRDDWVLFGIILGREFERSDDGWTIYNEWAARSAKYSDKGTEKAMRTYFYQDSLDAPQGGRQATIATILSRAAANGYAVPRHGLDGRPTIAYRPGRAVETIGRLLTLLARERESDADRLQRIYAFGSGMGSVIETHDPGARYTQDGRPPNGWVLKVSAHTPMSLGSRVTDTATIIRMSSNGAAPTQIECPTEVSTLMLKEYSKHFPRLNGIVQWPLIIGGRVAGIEEDYDATAGLVFALPEGLKLEGLKSSKHAAQEAWKWLRTVALDGFPFHTDRDAAAALALLLTFVQRRAMESAPAFLITAPKIGTGKTTLVKFASRAIHGRSLGAGPLSYDSEEQRKAITSALITNPPALLFDNLPAGSSFNSNELAIAMTSGEWEDRKLGSTERVTLPNRAVWTFTGNNISVKGDLKRRFVIIRMVSSQVAHHEQLFERNIETWPTEHRKEVLEALMTILLWGAKDKTTLTTESGFPQWDEDVRRVVVGLTGIDPFRSIADTSEDEEEDEEESSIATIMLSWASLCGEEKMTVAEWKEKVAEASKSSDSAKKRLALAVEGAVATLRNKPVDRIEAQDWGYAVRLMQDRKVIVEGVECTFERRGMKQKVAMWALVGAAGLNEVAAKEF